MKTYRIQARHLKSYIDCTVQAENDQDALNKFSQKVDDGTVKVEDQGFFLADKVYITFEEIDNVTTGVGIEEVRTGIEVGSPSIITG